MDPYIIEDELNNGPRGLGAIVKSSFIAKDPEAIDGGLNYIARQCIILASCNPTKYLST